MRKVLEKCFVAGWDHADGNAAVREGLSIGDTVILEREPANEFDPNAIAIYWGAGRIKIGFVPRNQNGALAVLMDEVYITTAKVVEVNPATSNPWKKCAIDAFVEIGNG